MLLLPIALIFIIFYFLLIRPQKKSQQDHAKMIQELKKKYKAFLYVDEKKFDEAIEAEKIFEPWDGLISRVILSDKKSQIASTLYFCTCFRFFGSKFV